MTTILVWLGQQAWWATALCLFGALGYAISALSSKRKRDIAQFSLEREVYQEQMTRAFLVAGLFLALGGILFLVSRAIVPLLPEPAATTAPPGVGLFTATVPPRTPDQPSPTPTSATDVITTPMATAPIVVTLAPEATATPSPTPTQVPVAEMQPDCPAAEAQLTLPLAGSDVSGPVQVQGTAQTNAFSFYKFEVRFPGSSTPNFIAQYDTEVENGFLGIWDVSDADQYPRGGPYFFQLVVVDIYGNTKVCTVPVNIVSP